MWRLVLTASMLLTLALGAVAQASPPPILIESVAIEKEGGSATLRFTARFAESFDESALPLAGTAVVMLQDGQRAQGKCLNVSLTRTDVTGGVATYVGRFNFLYGGASTLAGRADIGGSIYDFNGPLDGSPGTVSKATFQGSITGAGAAPIAQPVTITPDPSTVDPRTAEEQRAAVIAAAGQAAPQGRQSGQPLALVDGIASNPMPLLGLIVVVVAIVSAYLDRKRSIARATAG